jgi:hypothetical protein
MHRLIVTQKYAAELCTWLRFFMQYAEEFEAMCSNRKKFRRGIASHRCRWNNVHAVCLGLSTNPFCTCVHMCMHRNWHGLSAHVHGHAQSRAYIRPIRAPIGFLRAHNWVTPIMRTGKNDRSTCSSQMWDCRHGSTKNDRYDNFLRTWQIALGCICARCAPRISEIVHNVPDSATYSKKWIFQWRLLCRPRSLSEDHHPRTVKLRGAKI